MKKQAKTKRTKAVGKKPTAKPVTKQSTKNNARKSKKKNASKIKKKTGKISKSEKIRRLRISRTFAKKAYQKLADKGSENLSRKEKEQKRLAFTRLLNTNAKIADLTEKKQPLKKLTRSRGWNTQSFGMIQRSESEFIKWLKRSLKAFRTITVVGDGIGERFNIPQDIDLLLMYVSELVLSSSPYDILEMKYRLDESNKNEGIIYLNNSEDAN